MKFIILGYVVSGFFASASYPNSNKLLLIITWPIKVIAGVMNKPNRSFFTPLTGVFTVAAIWAVVSLFVFAATYPARFIDSSILSIITTVIMFGAGMFVLGGIGGKIMSRGMPVEDNIKLDLITILEGKGWSKEASEAGAFLAIDTLSEKSSPESAINNAAAKLTNEQLQGVVDLVKEYNRMMESKG